MPRIEHEPWCEIHDGDGKDESGRCSGKCIDFGPAVPYSDGWPPSTMGGLGASRDGDGPIDIYIDYRTQGGCMDVIALRSVREAVAASPDEFLIALDQLIETLGSDVPPARKVPPESVAS